MQRNRKPCEYCQRLVSLSSYSRHIRSHEAGTWVDPATIYHPNHDDLFCKFCNKECKNKNSLAQHEIRCKYNANRLSPIIPANFTFKGLSPWNAGHTIDSDIRLRKTVETRNYNRSKGLHKNQCGKNNPASNPIVKAKISKTCLDKSKKGLWHNSLAKIMYYNYKGYALHGTWELKYAIYLDRNNIKWVKNTESFPYIFKDSTHYYTPDFYLPDLDEYVEIKGYIRPDGREYAKWEQFPKSKTLRVLQESDLQKLHILDIDILGSSE